MSLNNLKKASLTSLAGGVMAGIASATERKAVDELITGIKDKSDKVRTEAWLSAGEVGAPAVKSLAKVMTDEDLEVARAAKRGLWKIVRHVGRPRADREKRAVLSELVGLLGDDQVVSVRREVLWMLSEIGDWKSVKPIAALLANNQLREDARMALQRITDKRALVELKVALEDVPEDFKLNIAQSLRQRGVEVSGLACVKLVPTRKTNVKPLK